jgi:hypothetical protein
MSEPVFSFQGPIVVEEPVVRELCRLARRGYESRHKSETFGFLYGTLGKTGRLAIRRAVYYRGGRKSRTGISFDDWSSVLRVLTRRRRLARRLRMRFLGGFHSHVEIAGKVFQGLSDSDRRSLKRDWMAELEAVTFVWAGNGRRPKLSPTSVVGHEPGTGYNYRIRVYAKRCSDIRVARVCMKNTQGLLLLAKPGLRVNCP